MKNEVKNNLKKHILSAISVAVIAALVVVLIIVTRKPEDASAGVTINGKTYNKDNPMVILQILSDKTYDEFGALIGNDYGSMPWNAIMKKAGNTIKSDDSTIFSAIQGYLKFVNDGILKPSSTGYALCVRYDNGEWRYPSSDFNYSNLFGTNDDVQTDKIKLFLCKKNENDTYELVKNSNGNEIYVRDVFSYFVFGDGDAEGCVTVKTMTPDELNKLSLQDAQKIIDSAALVNISSSRHQTYITQTIYESIMDKSKNPWPSDGKAQWTLGNNKLDLKPQIALYLMMQNVRAAKPIMFQSVDKNPSNGNYSNIARMLLVMSGIDRNVFTSDFAFKTEVSINNNEYTGNFGGIKIENNAITLYANDEYVKYNDKKPNFDGNGIFAYWKSYQKYYCELNNVNLTTSYNKWVDGKLYDKITEWVDGSYLLTYPFYNASDGTHRQKFLNKYCWEFNSDTSSTQNWLLGETFPYTDSDKISNEDRDYGTTYSEAKKLTDHNKTVDSKANLTGAKAVQYIMGAYKSTPSGTLNVLEIQPIGVYSYDTAEKARKIKTWFGLSADDTSVSVNVTSLSANGVNGLNEDFLATYDLIIIGAQGSSSINETNFGKLFNKGITIDKSVVNKVAKKDDVNTVTNQCFTLNGNDLTDKVYNQIMDYARKGLPIAMEKDIFYGNQELIETSTNVYKLSIGKLAKELYATGYSNIVSINNNGSTSDILNYYVKPKVNVIAKYVDDEEISHAIVNYRYDENTNSAELNPRAALKTLYFNGNVTADSEFTVNVYLDIDCDSIFTDDEKYYSGTGKGSLSNFTVSNIKTVPTNIPGYVSYKVEIIDSNGLKDNYVSAFAIDPGTNKRTVKVLQILPQDSNNKPIQSTLNLTDENGMFRQMFLNVEAITGLRLSVDVVTKKQFSDGINSGTLDLGLYSMIVLGFADNYGTLDNESLSESAVNAIKSFIKSDKSVLMTHDSISYMTPKYYKITADDKKLDQVALTETQSNSLTKLLRTSIGMKKSYQFSNVLSYTRLKITPYSWYTATGNSNNNSKTKTTNRIAQLNSGEITSYPYAITSEVASEIPVAKTHAQYFPLDLTLGSTRTSDVVVWYTLSDPDVTQDMFANTDGEDYKDYITNYPHDNNTNNADATNATKGYYGYFGQDAMNNYYIYSYGNVTYSSAGHRDITGEAEMKLFVNTFTRAILAGTVIPDVSYEEATIDESVTDHKEYVKYNYADYIKSKLTVKFSIEDSNYVSGAKNVSTIIYLYKADGASDGLYKEGSSDSIFLGYLDASDNSAQIQSSAPSSNNIISGTIYTIDDLWKYVSEDQKEKIINGQLKIGIQATNNYGKGYALLLNQSRKIFNLD